MDNENLSQQDIELFEGLLNFWKNKTEPTEKSKEPHHDDLVNHDEIDLDYFKGNNEIIDFLKFASNPYNIEKLKDKKQFLTFFKKYKELVGMLLILFPYIQKAGRNNCGVIVPTSTIKESNLRKKIKKIFK